MASLEGVLAGIPGYGGYLAQRQMNEQAGMQDLQQFGAVQGVLANIAAQQQKQAELQRQAQFRAELAANPGREREIAMKYSTNPADILRMPQARPAVDNRPEILKLTETLQNLPPESPIRTAIQGRIRFLNEGRPQAAPEKWSDPYSLNGVMVQKNENTGQVRTAVTRPPVVNVSTQVSTGGDKKYLETRGTDLAKSMGELEKAAGSAYNTIQAMDRFIEASKTGPQGSVQPIITGVQNFLSSFGYQSKDLTDIRKMEQAIGDVLQNKMAELGARGLTDRDMDVLRQALPRVATDAASRQQVADIVKRGSKSTIDEYIARRDEEMRTFPDFATRVPTPPWLRQYRPQQPAPGIPSMDAIDAEIRRRRGGK